MEKKIVETLTIKVYNCVTCKDKKCNICAYNDGKMKLTFLRERLQQFQKNGFKAYLESINQPNYRGKHYTLTKYKLVIEY